MESKTSREFLMQTVDEIVVWLRANRNDANRAGMARYGINVENAFGVNIPFLREEAKRLKNNTPLARELWATGFHEARIMAAMIASPKDFTPADMDIWVSDLNSWDLCDQCCTNLFRRLPYINEQVWNYALDEREFVRRVAFSLIASLAVKNRNTNDNYLFENYLELIERYSTDERNFVRKAVNWALRGIGKSNFSLHAKALSLAEKLSNSTDKTARWIGKDAYKELSSEKIIDYIDKHRPK